MLYTVDELHSYQEQSNKTMHYTIRKLDAANKKVLHLEIEIKDLKNQLESMKRNHEVENEQCNNLLDGLAMEITSLGLHLQQLQTKGKRKTDGTQMSCQAAPALQQ